jgi:cysteine desulfurase
VTGVIQPWETLVELCRRRAIPFFCDAAQWLGRESATGLGACDFVTGCAHKAGGPRGVGFLKCSSRAGGKSLLFGGPQEEGRRAGTENVAGVLSMVATLEARHKLMGEMKSRRQMRDHFIERLRAGLPGVKIMGETQPRLWNTVAAMMPDAECHQRWVVKLDKLGVAVSTGSACSSGKEEPSPVLLAMGCAAAAAGRVLRFSSGWETTPKDWDILLDAILRAADELRPVAAI